MSERVLSFILGFAGGAVVSVLYFSISLYLSYGRKKKPFKNVIGEDDSNFRRVYGPKL